MEVGSIFHPSMRTQLITSILKVFVGSGIFLASVFQYRTRNQFDELSNLIQSGDPAKRARAIVQAVSP